MLDQGEKKDDDTSVRVAIRIRPQNGSEKVDMCQVCTAVQEDGRQVVLGKDKAFTFDHVHDMPALQDSVYTTCVKDLIEGCFEGYNATVFAYGQTGSGKTYTMGTGFDTNVSSITDQIGIIPRAVDHLFLGIEERRRQAFENGEPAPEFKVTAQFMELYNEEILDLLDTTRDPESRGRKSHHRIHEDANGGIYVVGITTRPVSSLQDTVQCLKTGALSRATASTNMNVQSSRSHAIFTLHIRQHRVVKDQNVDVEDGKDTDSTQPEFETLTAKFHFVDLAGSERLKRTGATGERAKEGISINCGLLALGNVISALGDVAKKGSHVPYRDSKLTRLLQDSLGGNSRTLMIACISPSDRDFMETLNTLKYANRARNIKNKVVANQDKASRQLASLRSEIASLQQELMEYKTGRRLVDADGQESINDMIVENGMLQTENDKLRQRMKALQDTIDTLKARNSQLMIDTAVFSVSNGGEASKDDITNLVKKYVEEIEDLKTRLSESESLCEHLQHSNSTHSSVNSRMSLSSMSVLSSYSGGMEAPMSPEPFEPNGSILATARKDVKRLKKLKKTQEVNINQEGNKENLNGVKQEEDGKENGEDDVGEEEDETDEEDENSGSSSDSDTEGADSDNVHEDLANITREISIKQHLITEVENMQKSMNLLKVQYEEKVTQLHQKIKETELERDKVLSSIDKKSNSTNDQVKKVKQEYEKKLSNLQDELKKMQTEKKKHAKLQKNNTQYERHLKTLQHELGEMKKTKVRLMKQVKEEVDKNKITEAKRMKEVAQMKKEQLRRDNTIKTLERQTMQKDAVLKRKQEEVEALRRRQKPMSSKAAGRVGRYDRPTTIPIAPVSITRQRRTRTPFSPKAAKQKWDSIEKNMSSVITKRQTISNMEKDMDIWLKQRDKCSKELERYEKKKAMAVKTNQSKETIERLDNAIDDLSLKVGHAQENIGECQCNIMQMEEAQYEGEGVELSSIVEKLTLGEAKYMIEKLYQHGLDKGLFVSQKDTEVRELQGRLHQTELNNVLQQDLLRHMMEDNVSLDVDDLITYNDDNDDAESTSSSSTFSPTESMFESATPAAGVVLPTGDAGTRKEKARRKTTTTQDLLYAGGDEPDLTDVPKVKPVSGPNVKQEVAKIERSHSTKDDGDSPQSPTKHLLPSEDFDSQLVSSDPKSDSGSTEVTSGSDEKLMPPPKLPVKVKSNLPRASPIMRRREIEASPSLSRKIIRSDVEASPVLPRKAFSRSNSTNDAMSDTSPPGTPQTIRRSMSRSTDENVFSRLTNTSTTSPNPNRGSIVSCQSGQTKSPLICTHTADGHTKAVLSVFATDQLLFTGSKDRTAKSWDLGTGREMLSLSGHPNNVQKVVFCPSTQLVFTVSQSSIRVWDLRKSPNDNCIKTLSSSGLTTSGSSSLSMNRQSEFIHRDHQINDIRVSADGNNLYCAAGNVVQIWDIRRYSQVGRLSGHAAPVMSLVLDMDRENRQIISGSKDHSIKIFEVIDDAAGILTPKHNLEPPHYDGIQSLALRDRILFSGSRDMNIKKWDLVSRKCIHSVNSAHKDWVCALDFVPGTNILLSGCRGGVLKLWQPDTCASLGEVRAHSSQINAIATNSTSIFTASNDCVGIWQARLSQEGSM